jgi:putative aminopeptidase FrvX
MLAGGRVSGVAAGGRAAALAMAEIIRRSSGRGATGSVTLAWVTQSEYGNRGLLRLLEVYKPDRLMLMRGSTNAGEDPRGAIGQLGSGPVVRDGGINLPDKWKALPVQTLMVPVVFAQTPVETVDARDVDALAERVASAVGLPPLARPDVTPPAPDGASAARPVAAPGEIGSAKAAKKDVAFDTLGALIESYGVSAHERPVREQVLKRVPAWAKPQVDGKGNIVVSFGSGGKPLLFMAHMDEVGFDITNVAADGTAAVRVRGGMYLSNFESHPVVVQTAKGPVHAVLAPRTGYTSAKEAQPAANALYLYFGTSSAAETAALGVAAGDSLTVRKTFAPLAAHRATGRSMDDRNGSAALLLALQQIDPKTVTNQVTFAWTVEEETGLAGAAYLAETMKPDAAFAIDTFVSTDTPVDIQRLAGARLGHGAVLRVLDSRTIVPPHIVDRIVAIARTQKVPLQLGTTSGGTDGSVFSAGGAIDVGLSWPGRYSHSPVEIMDRRDLDALVKLIVAVAKHY